MDNFDKYIELRNSFQCCYKGIEMNRVAFFTLWDIATGINNNISIKSILLCLIAVNMKQLKFDKSKNTILSTYGMVNRKDHMELYDNVINKLQGKASKNNILFFDKKIHFNLHTWFYIWRCVSKIRITRKLTLTQKLYLWARSVEYANTIDILSKMNFDGVEKYLCQFNFLEIENLLTQFFKNKGIPSYSLQEGIYMKFKVTRPIDTINYYNMESDYLLAWGQYSIDEYISTGISKKRFCLAGYPKNVDKLMMKDNKSIKRIMVMLARDSFRNSNNQLIGILSKFSDKFEFNLKLHPSCDFNYYSNLAKTCNMGIISQDKTIGQCLNNILYDLSIAVNTTAYYDSLIKGVPCLRYSDGTFDLMCGLDQDCFSSADEFEKSISFLLGLTAREYQKKVDDILKYAIGLGIDNYCMILL